MGNEMLRAALDEGLINSLLPHYWRVSVVDVTASTQSGLVELARERKAQPGDVIVANFQSSGRGRLSRTFEAPRDSALLFSMYLEPDRPRQDWGWIALIAGASVAQTLSAFNANVKWPNDILVNEKKISGVIAEIVGDAVVIGIGLNVGMNTDELPVQTATSLALEGASDIDRNHLLAKLLAQFQTNFTSWDAGEDSVTELYVHLSSTLGTKVQIHYPNDEIEVGLAVAISKRGELVLESGTHVQAGDIVHLR